MLVTPRDVLVGIRSIRCLSITTFTHTYKEMRLRKMKCCVLVVCDGYAIVLHKLTLLGNNYNSTVYFS